VGVAVASATLTYCIQMDKEFINQQSKLERNFGLWKVGRTAGSSEDIRSIELPIKCYAEAKNQSNYFGWASHRLYHGENPKNITLLVVNRGGDISEFPEFVKVRQLPKGF